MRYNLASVKESGPTLLGALARLGAGILATAGAAYVYVLQESGWTQPEQPDFLILSAMFGGVIGIVPGSIWAAFYLATTESEEDWTDSMDRSP